MFVDSSFDIPNGSYCDFGLLLLPFVCLSVHQSVFLTRNVHCEVSDKQCCDLMCLGFVLV